LRLSVWGWRAGLGLFSFGAVCSIVYGAGAADVAALRLTATASSAKIDEAVTIILTETGLPPGSSLTLHAPHGAKLWRGAPDCDAADHSKTLFQVTASSEFLCLMSTQAQSIRAVVSAEPPTGATVVAASEAIKFAADPWWKSTIVTSGIVALLGAFWGLSSTLFAQNYERRNKAREERHALAVEQEQFLVRNLLPELTEHLEVLQKNTGLTAGEEKDVQSLPKKNLVTTAGGPRAEQLASYFASLNLKRNVVADIQSYSNASAEYNRYAELVKRNKLSLAALADHAQALREQLAALGLT
jgi:hypothetical protein